MNGVLVLLVSLVGVENLPPIQLVLDGCPQVRAAELSRLLSVELGEGLSVQQVDALPAEGAATLSVTLRCRAPKWEVDVDDALTGKRLIRKLPAPTSSVERYAALSASQLVVASWLEFLARRETKDVRPAALVAQSVARAQVDPVEVAPAPPPPVEAGPRLSIEGGLLGRLRQDAGDLASLGPMLRVALGWARAELGVSGTVEWGTYRLEVGGVDARLLAGSIDGALSLWAPRPWFSLWLSTRITGGAARLAGRPLVPFIPSGEVSAFQGEAALGLGPRFTLGRFSIRPRLELGVAFAAPRGLIPGGFVQPLGSFLALSAGVGWAF